MTAGAFFDSSIPLYLLSDDLAKATRAEEILAQGGTLSVQVLNEFVAAARRKNMAPWPAIEQTLAAMRHVCEVKPLTVATHDRALVLAKRYGFPIYDATIAASALESGSHTLYSEDFQHGQKLEGMVILNPFL